GIRRLYEPRFLERILLLLLLVAAAYYAVFAIVQWTTLTPEALRFDFANYFGGAQAAAHGSDVYADFKRSWGTEAWVVAYIYPPFFAELLAPLTPLGLVGAARVWLLAVHAAFFGSLALLLRLHPELSRAGRLVLLVVTVVTMLASPGSWQFFTVVLPRIGLGTANWDNGSIDGLVSRIVMLAPHLLGGATQTAAKVVIALAAVSVIGVTIWLAGR